MAKASIRPLWAACPTMSLVSSMPRHAELIECTIHSHPCMRLVRALWATCPAMSLLTHLTLRDRRQPRPLKHRIRKHNHPTVTANLPARTLLGTQPRCLPCMVPMSMVHVALATAHALHGLVPHWGRSPCVVVCMLTRPTWHAM